MVFKLLVLVILLSPCKCAPYSSFWAPLYEHKILNYRVDVPFDPDAARSARDRYTIENGYRGEKLIANLGNGNGPGNSDISAAEVYGDVEFKYT